MNLQLSVGPLRADGYHDLVTVFHAVTLFDEVTVRPADRTSVHVTGQGAALIPAGRANLAVRAARALATAGPRRQRPPAVRIEIRKRIPVSAGLAGGSADAAATLVACNELWRTGLTQAELREVAASLGSDVPFALLGGTAIGQGRGEQLTAALTAGTYHWVLAFASGGLSTPEVYAACDRMRAAHDATATPAGIAGSAAAARQGGASEAGDISGDGRRGAAPGQARGPGHNGGVAEPALSTELIAALRSGDPAAVGPLLSNDLEPAAISLRPQLRLALAAGREFGALGAIVSGSGPTCVFLAADARRAREIAVSLTSAGVCRGVARVTGPAAGAAVVPSALN